MEKRIAVLGGEVTLFEEGTHPEILVIVHGGPGIPSSYLSPLDTLSSNLTIRRYDQLGCGSSGPLTDLSLMTVSRSVEELKSVASGRPAHLLGHSWGAVVAVEFALQYPDLVKSLILASPSLSIPLWRTDAKRLRKKLPLITQMILSQGERDNSFFSPEYLNAVDEYNKKFVYGSDTPQPEVLEASKTMSSLVYNAMWGPNEAVINGTLKDYDCTSRLGALKTKTLITCGRNDEATPETCEIYRSLIKNASLCVFEDSAHFPHLSETSRYIEVLKNHIL